MKICDKCNIGTSFLKGRNECISCTARIKKGLPLDPDMKYCPSCETDKHISDYGINRARYRGLHWQCKECQRNDSKVYGQENKEKRAAYKRIYRTRKNTEGQRVCSFCKYGISFYPGHEECQGCTMRLIKGLALLPEMKYCPTCEQDKHIDNYGFTQNKKHQLNWQCKDCHSERDKKYSSKDKSRLNYLRRAYEKNFKKTS